ncbi:MAG TPA: PorP/SprF family type IX secretion system membrane protein, partial [Bacteroidia bacterium]|nr:PorP/SprF family type IX secretion system membrane protein [Bacteroidia bacterium]
KLNEETKVSLGLSAGVLQWGIDGHKLQLHDAGDENLLTQYQTTYVPDFGAGVLVYSKKYYIGIAVPQMYQSKINLYPGAESKSKLVTHFNVNGAYKFDLGEDFKLEPSFILKYATPAPMKLDVGVRGIYREQVWLGAAYRHNDAVTALVGYLYKNYLMIGYSYDFSTTNIRRYSSGTHEVMLGLRFSRQHNRAWVADK